MQGTISKLQTIGMLIALVSAIGGGFYTWGTFNQRIDALEKKKYVVNQKVDLSEIRKEIKELDNDVTVQLKFLQEQIQKANVEININKATLEYLAAKIDEVKLENDNPLLKGL